MPYLYVQGTQAEGTSPQTATYGSTPTAGDLLVAVVKRNTQTGTAVSVSDGGGAWMQASISPFNFNGTSSQLCIFYKLADVSQATAVSSAGSGTHFLDIYEFSGAPASITGIVLASNATSAGSGTTTSSAAAVLTTTMTDTLVFNAVGLASTITAPSWVGATIGQQNNSAGSLIQMVDSYLVAPVAGTYQPAMTWTTSRAWGNISIAFASNTSTTSNPTLGNATIEAITTGGFNHITGGMFTGGPTSGTLQSISFYCAAVSGTPNVQFGVYSATGTATLIGNTASQAVTTSPGWVTVSASGTLNDTAGAYYIMLNCSASVNIYYQASGGSGLYNNSSMTFGTWPGTYTPAVTGATWLVSCYFTYTTGGSGPVAPSQYITYSPPFLS